MKTAKIAVLAAFFAASLAAQPVEIKLRVVASDTATRKKDTNFVYAATSGFSVVQTLGNYYLFGNAGTHRKAWNGAGTDMWDLVFPPSPPNPDWPGYAGDKPCDPKKSPLVRDDRCGDASGVVWKQPTSTVPRWNYWNADTNSTSFVQPFPAPGIWPRQWPGQYPLMGIPGHQTTVDAHKVNLAIPAGIPPTATPSTCTRALWNPSFHATGAANSKAIYVNGKWYMAFNEAINNPTSTAGWTAQDLFTVGWATSTNGRDWTIQRILFRSAYETWSCGGGLLLTQLFVDNGTFYMLLNELGNSATVGGRSHTRLLRAPVDTNRPEGYGTWQIAANNPSQPNQYLWVNVPTSGLLNTDATGTNALNAASLMVTNAYVKQAAIARVFNSSAANSPSRLIGITVGAVDNEGVPALELWSAPDLDTVMTKESTIDRSGIKLPFLQSFGWEFAFTNYPDHTAATPRIIGRELDLWLNGNFWLDGENPDGHTRHFTGYRTTATLSGGIFSPRGALRTRSGANYLTAAADNSINATGLTADGIQLDERWILVDANGGALNSGETVYLLARNGLYLTNSGGTTLTATAAAPSTFETFVIEKKNAGSTTIGNGDLIALRSPATTKYIIAALGGGGAVSCNGLDTNSNTRFTYVVN